MSQLGLGCVKTRGDSCGMPVSCHEEPSALDDLHRVNGLRRSDFIVAQSPFFRSVLFLFFCCSMSHNHAKPMVMITMTMKMAYSIIGTAAA
jgi:hypothetical protein